MKVFDVHNEIGQGKELDKFKDIIEFLPIGITVSDNDGNLIMTNSEGANLLGIKKDEPSQGKLFFRKWHLIRKDYTDLPPEEDPTMKAIREGIRVENPEVGIVNEGSVKWATITATPLPSGQGVFSSYVNISDKIEREKQLLESNNKLQELVRDRDKFYRIIAHDLRNPFTTIFGCCALLLDNFSHYTNDYIERFIRLMQASSKQTFDLLQNLLDWSCSQAGLLKFNPEQTDVSALVNEALDLIKSQAKQKGIAFKTHIEEHCTTYIDKNMIATVVRNLITNAVKYSYRDSEIYITVKSSQANVIISVADHGTGIDNANAGNLFFKKFTTLGTEEETGSGLGLMIGKDFIDQHKGKIWFESEKGKGSEFFLSIPIQAL